MEEEGSYGIISYRELAELKKQLADLKARTSTDSAKPLIDSMAKLTQNMDSMLQLFKNAADELKLEESTQMQAVRGLEPLSEKIEQLLEQTKTIAESIVTVADMVKELKESKEPPKTQPMIQPQQSGFGQSMPPIGAQQPMERMQGGIQQPQFRQPPQPFARPEAMPPFGMPPGMPLEGELPLEPFPPMPEPKRRGILGRLRR